jgi:hypothetical protein
MPFHAPPKGTRLPGNPFDGHTLAQIIPAIEQLVGNEIERLHSAGVSPHRARIRPFARSPKCA